MKGNRAQVQMVLPLIGLFIFAIVGTALLPTIGDSIYNAKNVRADVLNESFGSVPENTTLSNLTTDNIPVTGISAVRNVTSPGTAIGECGVAPCYIINNLVTGNITMNLSSIGTTGQFEIMYIDYTYEGDSNLTSTDGALLDLWPTFIIIGGLLAILAALGLGG